MVCLQGLETSIRQNVHRAHTNEEVVVDDESIRGVFGYLIHAAKKPEQNQSFMVPAFGKIKFLRIDP